MLKHGLPAAKISEPSASVQKNSTEVTFFAILNDFKLIAFNGNTKITEQNDFLGGPFESFKRDTFKGVFAEWDFALIQKDKDVEIYFESRPEFNSKGEEHDMRIFRAFLNAIAFTHGKHAWPFMLEHRRDGKLVLDRLHLTSEVAHTWHAPFTEAIDYMAKVNKKDWSFSVPLEKAFAFFSENSKLSHEITNLLYLLREASYSGVPKGITLLSLCSLFESLLHAAYDERIAAVNAEQAGRFESARKESLSAVKEKAGQSPDIASYGRIINILEGAQALRPKDKFEAIVDALQMLPKEQWSEIFDVWRYNRNPLSHRLSHNGGESEKSIRETLLAESKIAGAINCIILRLMNYKGPVLLSAYEEKYGRI